MTAQPTIHSRMRQAGPVLIAVIGALGAALNAADRPAAPAPPEAGGNLMSWRKIAELPPVSGQSASHGLSGVFAGALDSSHGIVAGGTFYPEKGPLEGGRKAWTDSVFVLEQRPGAQGGEPHYEWVAAEAKLPRPLANGVSISLDDGVLCCGGADTNACHADVFLLQWNATAKKVVRVDFPPLPKPIGFAGGARSGSWVYIAGGTTSPGGRSGADFFGLDLSQRNNAAAFQWQALPVLPRTALFPVCAGQNDGTADCFFIFGGRDLTPGKTENSFADGLKFLPTSRSWTTAGKIQVSAGRAPVAVSGGSAVALDDHRILVLGGDDGEVSRLLDLNARHTGTAEETEAYRKLNEAILAAHPGYRREMLLFNARTTEWRSAGAFPQGTPAVTPAFLWDGAVVLAGGESRPGHRSPHVWLGTFEAH